MQYKKGCSLCLSVAIGDPQPLLHSLLLQVVLQQLIAFALSDGHWIYVQDM